MSGASGALFEQLSATETQAVEQLKAAVADLVQKHAHLQHFCSEWTYVRYLRARQWNLDKALKMLRATLEWRISQKPHEIKFKQVEEEAVTGKTFVSPFADKSGRSVVVMRPRNQNTSDEKMQVLFLVYCLEHASRMADQQRAGKMTWLIDFEGYSMRNAPSIKTSIEVLNILQNHYPERLGQAVCYHAPGLFSMTWKAVSPFIDTVTHKKILFVPKGSKDEPQLMSTYFELHELEPCVGGTGSGELFSMAEYKARCLKEDEEVGRAISLLAKSAVGSTSTGSSLSELTTAPALPA